MEPRVAAYSQTYRLKERMTAATIGHGQEVRADLTGIRVTAVEGWRRAADPVPATAPGVIFFCNMGPVRVLEVLNPGDGRALPNEVILENLAVPAPGMYDILNALIHSNGALRVIADSATRIVRTAEEFERTYV